MNNPRIIVFVPPKHADVDPSPAQISAVQHLKDRRYTFDVSSRPVPREFTGPRSLWILDGGKLERTLSPLDPAASVWGLIYWVETDPPFNDEWWDHIIAYFSTVLDGADYFFPEAYHFLYDQGFVTPVASCLPIATSFDADYYDKIDRFSQAEAKRSLAIPRREEDGQRPAKVSTPRLVGSSTSE